MGLKIQFACWRATTGVRNQAWHVLYCIFTERFNTHDLYVWVYRWTHETIINCRPVIAFCLNLIKKIQFSFWGLLNIIFIVLNFNFFMPEWFKIIRCTRIIVIAAIFLSSNRVIYVSNKLSMNYHFL